MSVIQAGNTTSTSLIYTGDTTGNLVFTTGGANTVALTLANTQAATFANNVTISGTTAHTGNASFTGNVTFTSGTNGIIFNNPSALANSTLNDYETGTWTPSVSSTNGTITTVGATSGFYTKVGNMVSLTLFINITTNGTGAGAIVVSNLPFTINSTMAAYGVGREQNLTGYGLFGYLNQANNYIYIQRYDGAYPGANGYGLGFSITYRATF